MLLYTCEVMFNITLKNDRGIIKIFYSVGEHKSVGERDECKRKKEVVFICIIFDNAYGFCLPPI